MALSKYVMKTEKSMQNNWVFNNNNIFKNRIGTEDIKLSVNACDTLLQLLVKPNNSILKSLF